MGVKWMLLTLAVVFPITGCSSEEAECDRDEDCPPGRYCRVTTGECAYECTHDRECPEGYLCTHRGRCEAGCRSTNGGVEACDGVDNDCDGLTDELESRPCQNSNEHGTCEGTERCLDAGWVCDAAEAAPEECDGADNDCDQQTDEDLETVACPLQQGVCTGAVSTCTGAEGWSMCGYGDEYESGDEVSCDGKDNDCDGATDEDLFRGGCVVENEHGRCSGFEVCQGSDWVCSAPEPQAEVCDQVDNDCDGETDEDAADMTVCETGTIAQDGIDNNCDGMIDEPGGCMVRVTVGEVDVYVDVYENTVYSLSDCTGIAYGQTQNDYPDQWPVEDEPTGVTLYACSVPGVRPSGWISLYQARRACQAQGKRLCTQAEWSVACGGPELQEFPYGSSYEPETCNTYTAGIDDVVPTGSMEDCVSPLGTNDMSGNLQEWVDTLCVYNDDYYTLQGGSFEPLYCFDVICDPDEPDHQDELVDQFHCDYPALNRDCIVPAAMNSFIGFRCCMDPP